MGKVIKNGVALLNCNVGESTFHTPYCLYAQSQNRRNLNSFSYTFTYSGTFQYYIMIRSASAYQSSLLDIGLNGVSVSPIVYSDATSGATFVYGDITVSANDVFTVETTQTETNMGIQVFVVENADISKFSLIGWCSNNNTTFPLNVIDQVYIHSYNFGYYSSNNQFHYEFGVFRETSIPTPNDSAYWYGGTYAIRIC
jgi:hypothetical protein